MAGTVEVNCDSSKEAVCSISKLAAGHREGVSEQSTLTRSRPLVSAGQGGDDALTINPDHSLGEGQYLQCRDKIRSKG